MQISEVAGGVPAPGAEPCRFPKLEECAHFHYERVQLPKVIVSLQTNIDQSLHSQHNDEDETDWFMVQVTSGDECWLLQRNLDNFKMLDHQLHQCIYERRVYQLPDLNDISIDDDDEHDHLIYLLNDYLNQFSLLIDNSVNCGPVLNWLQMDNKGHRLLVPSEESRSINTPAVAAAYSVRRYVSQARDELNLEVGDMISVIDMASPGESMWWRGKRGFQVGFFPQHCVHIIGDKVPRNMPLPPPVVGTLALTPIKPVLRKHGKLITFFRSFILNRPSRRRLKQSGILKERVFGCDLGEHLSNSRQQIPMVLKCCAEFIESHGIVDGIYRLSGVTSNIQKLRNAFDEDRIPDLYTDDILQDIHSVASLLKMYFRELPNPLCTYQLYQSFVNAVQGVNSSKRTMDERDRLLMMREAVQKLPPPHYRTLEYLMCHLAAVARHGHETGMTTRNIAIVWAPNLLRCAELEVGGVAALQGVGVQAVVTEFLICYAHLIFCDHLPATDRNDTDIVVTPQRIRPKSLAIAAPPKLITLEEARNKHLGKDECNYIEVGGGPKNLPPKYHTVIDLPNGAPRKRGHSKRSPSGWRALLFMRTRKASTPCVVDQMALQDEGVELRRRLRTVKSAESLTSDPMMGGNDVDQLGPLCVFTTTTTTGGAKSNTGHNRSVSHDSYFDTMQTSKENSMVSLLELSEIRLNFDLEESEMRIFSDDESLICSPKMQKDAAYRRLILRPRDDSTTNSTNPSPKKQARIVLLSPESLSSRKRTRLEDQLSDIQYIDCATPDIQSSPTTTSTVIVHHPNDVEGDTVDRQEQNRDFYRPRNKSPRNSDSTLIEDDLSPQTPVYSKLHEDSSSVTSSPTSPTTPNPRNILINITYRSPVATPDVVEPYERAIVPTSVASLPTQQANQSRAGSNLSLPTTNQSRSCVSLEAVCSTNKTGSLDSCDVLDLSASGRSSRTEYTASPTSVTSSTPPNGSSEVLDETTTSSGARSCGMATPDDVTAADSCGGAGGDGMTTPEDVYEQVKYFKRSVDEVNALLAPDAGVYENVSVSTATNEKLSVKDLAGRFEEKRRRGEPLPPCVRARNLRQQLKTRSLDEEEFGRMGVGAESDDDGVERRRRSFDAVVDYRTNSLPKMLNQPKALPGGAIVRRLDVLHSSHEQIDAQPIDGEDEERRKRIERYKEERRKFLSEKYRSESFREDKDVLLAKLRLFSGLKHDKTVEENVGGGDEDEGEENEVKLRDGGDGREMFHDRRRHTYERETEVERMRRISLDGNKMATRKTISPPPYCIKDMKALFESKSKQ